jgi:hypothetical protein
MLTVSCTTLGAKFLQGPEEAGNQTVPDIKFNPSTENDPSDDEDEFRSLAEIVRANGFIFEDHWVTTSDGYILNLMRIPGKQSEK